MHSLQRIPFRLVDALWLLVLVLYVFAGMMLASFHGDEAIHIYTSIDYATAFLDGNPASLMVNPPYDIDADNRIRLINGSVTRYAIGLSWHLAGLSVNNLPPRPGWDWGLTYERNVETGHRPSEALLRAGRLASTTFLAFSVLWMFGIGWQFGRRPLAYLVSGLYTVNPIILLNGRRALVEGSLLCFGLLAVLIALQISRRREQGGTGLWGWWIALVIVSALALASKYNGAIFVVSAFGGILLAEVIRVVVSKNPSSAGWGRFTPLLVTIGKMAVATVLVIGLLIALSPALWNDPVARLRDLVETFQGQMTMVVGIVEGAPTSMAYRAEEIITNPFVAPAAHFELPSYAEVAPITAEIQQYMASPLSGLQFGLILGIPLTLAAGIGTIAAFWPRLRPYSVALAAVLVVWLLVTAANLMLNPLPWQRYYVVLIPVATVLASTGLLVFWRLIRRNQS